MPGCSISESLRSTIRECPRFSHGGDDGRGLLPDHFDGDELAVLDEFDDHDFHGGVAVLVEAPFAEGAFKIPGNSALN